MEWEQIKYPAYNPYALVGWCVECGEPIYIHSVCTGDWRGQTMHRDPRQNHVAITQGGISYPRCYSAPHRFTKIPPQPPNGESICVGELR